MEHELGWLVPCLLAFVAARPSLNLIDGLPWLACGFVTWALRNRKKRTSG